jgi:hypothetical protein
MLGYLGIKKLNVFYISDRDGAADITVFNNNCRLIYIDIPKKEYLKFLITKGAKAFAVYNPNSLYILDNGNHSDIKRMITSVEGFNVDIVRGSSQKSHLLSPLEIRLSFYISAMFNCDYNKIFRINSFNILDKNRYLPGVNRRKGIDKT